MKVRGDFLGPPRSTDKTTLMEGNCQIYPSDPQHNKVNTSDKEAAFLDLRKFYVFLFCVCYAFVSVCLFVPCGHLLGKG